MNHKKYAAGILVAFYELEMYQEYAQSLINAARGYEQDILHVAWFNTSEHFEKIDNNVQSRQRLIEDFYRINEQIRNAGIEVLDAAQCLKLSSQSPRAGIIIDNDDYELDGRLINIAYFRRWLNATFCDRAEFILWGETDSLWPAQTFHCIESIQNMAIAHNTTKYFVTFANRKMWDPSWQAVEHPLFSGKQYLGLDEGGADVNVSDCYTMTIDEMNEINSRSPDIEVMRLSEPKFDGSCLAMSTDLIKCGVNIPPCIFFSGEDTSMGEMAKKMLGPEFVQFAVKNILRVHNRKHSRKRIGVLNENNPMSVKGIMGKRFHAMKDLSKANLSSLFVQGIRINTVEDAIKEEI